MVRQPNHGVSVAIWPLQLSQEKVDGNSLEIMIQVQKLCGWRKWYVLRNSVGGSVRACWPISFPRGWKVAPTCPGASSHDLAFLNPSSLEHSWTLLLIKKRAQMLKRKSALNIWAKYFPASPFAPWREGVVVAFRSYTTGTAAQSITAPAPSTESQSDALVSCFILLNIRMII